MIFIERQRHIVNRRLEAAGIPARPRYEGLPERPAPYQEVAEAVRPEQTLVQNLVSGGIQFAPYLAGPAGAGLFAFDVAKDPGMIPEMVGRLPVFATLRALDTDALVKILTEPKNALVKQYQKLLEMEDAELKFTDGALKALAKKAISRDTGARALRAIMEELMIDLMYRLPEEPKGMKYSVTKEVVQGKVELFDSSTKSKKESA